MLRLAWNTSWLHCGRTLFCQGRSVWSFFTDSGHVGPRAGLVAHVDAVALPNATPAMTEASVETVWRVHRRARVAQFPISDNLAALMALVMADLSESQRETLTNLIFQRGVDLTTITVQQLREFLIALFHAPRSSLDNPSWTRKIGSQ